MLIKKYIFRGAAILVLLQLQIVVPMVANSQSNHRQDPVKMYLLEEKKIEDQSSAKGATTVTPQLFDQAIEPIGHVKAAFPRDCQPRNVENALFKIDRNGRDFATIAQKLFKKCEGYWSSPEKMGLVAIIDFLYTYYNVYETTNIKERTITIRDGTVMDAFIAVHDNVIKRPWVIVKCGVFCTVSDASSTANYLMHLFDQSPFNVIFLSNRTGTEYIQQNYSLTMAGYLEAHDVYEVAHWLKEESEYRDTIDSLHVMGISLGGSTAMLIDPLKTAYGYSENNKLFQSVMAICPVVNLRSTLADMYGPTLKGVVFSRYSWDQLQSSKQQLAEAQDYLNLSRPPPIGNFPDMLGTIVTRYASKWADQFATQFRNTREIRTKSDLWELNEMKNYKNEITTPYFVWASTDDMVVDNEINTASLYKSEVYKKSPQLGVLNVSKGNHCGFATSYGYPITSAILRAFVLNHSPDFAAKRSLKSANVSLNSDEFNWYDVHLRQWWRAYPLSDKVNVYFEVYDPFISWECRMSNPIQSSQNCRRVVQKQITLNDLSFLKLTVPNNNTEAKALSRKLNGTLRITSDGRILEGTSYQPNTVEWYSYE